MVLAIKRNNFQLIKFTAVNHSKARRERNTQEGQLSLYKRF